MNSRIGFIQNRIRVAAGALGPAGDLVVFWTERLAGQEDPVTGGWVGDVEVLSGTLRAICHEEPARAVVRQFAEIQTGDLIADIPDDTIQTLSGTVGLDYALERGARFLWAGRFYTVKEVGDGLDAAWDAVVGGRRLMRTLLLRKEA